jgi:hypothetical protein
LAVSCQAASGNSSLHLIRQRRLRIIENAYLPQMNICSSKLRNSSMNFKNTIDTVDRVGYLPPLYRPLLCSGPAASHLRTAGFFALPSLWLFEFFRSNSLARFPKIGVSISLADRGLWLPGRPEPTAATGPGFFSLRRGRLEWV